MATHPSVLAWRIPGTVEPGGLLSMGSHSWTRLKPLSSRRHEILSIYHFFFSFLLEDEFQLFCHPSHYSSNLQPLLLGKDHMGNLLLTVDLLSSMEIPLEENMQESTLVVESEFLLSQICCYLSVSDMLLLSQST